MIWLVGAGAGSLVTEVQSALDSIATVRRRTGMTPGDRIAGFETVAEKPVVAFGPEQSAGSRMGALALETEQRQIWLGVRCYREGRACKSKGKERR